MSASADILTFRLCSSVEPSIRYGSMYTRKAGDALLQLRLVYIANDDLVFLNQCTRGSSEDEATNCKQPYQSVAVSHTGQTFILFRNNEPVCVAEVQSALLHLPDEGFDITENDFLITFFWSRKMTVAEHAALVQFFTGYCSCFAEVKRLFVKAEDEEEIFTAAGYTPYPDAAGNATTYYITSFTPPQT